jgi:TPR repeat protein
MTRYHQVAEQGVCFVQVAIGHVYLDRRDYVEAVKWYRLAAEQSQSYLGKYQMAVVQEQGLSLP